MKTKLLKRIRDKWFIEPNHYDRNDLKLYKKDFTTSVWYVTNKKDWVDFIKFNRNHLLNPFFRSWFFEDVLNKIEVRERRKNYLAFKKAQQIYKKMEENKK